MDLFAINNISATVREKVPKNKKGRVKPPKPYRIEPSKGPFIEI
jgi:hypothetical protein